MFMFDQVANARFANNIFTITNANKADHEREYVCSVTDERGVSVRKTATVYIIGKIIALVSY